MLEIKNFIIYIAPYLPFFSAAVVSSTQFNISSFISRILEVSIVAAVLLYANVQVLDAKLAHLTKDIAKIEANDDSIENKVRENRKTLTTILIQVESIKNRLNIHTDNGEK